MSDFNSSLPIRTQSNGDAVVNISDGTIQSQLLSVDASGRIVVKLDDGSGNLITSQISGTQRALDVGINVAGVQVDPRQIRALTSADVVTANQGTAAATHSSPWWIHLTDGANDSALLATGELKVAVTQLLTEDHNYGAVGANTLRTAALVGNATGAADFGNGATGAQTLRTAANLAVAGADVSNINPVPVSISSTIPGTSIQNYNTAAAIAAGSSSNHDYTVTTLKTLNLARIWSTASGKLKIEIQVETGVATGIFNSKFVGFNSTSTPNIDITVVSAEQVAAGVRIRVIRTNLDKQPMDLYSTIEGTEV